MIFQYWEDPPAGRHWYYELCMATVRRHNPRVRVIGREEAGEIIGGVPPELDRVYVSVRSNWIRKMIALRLGGLYLDADFISHRPLAPVEGLAECFDFVGYREWHGGWMDNFFAARKDSPVLKTAADHAIDTVRRHAPKDPPWTSTSRGSIEFALRRHPWSLWTRLPTHIVAPTDYAAVDWFFAETPWHPRGNSLGFMTCFHSLRHRLAGMSEAEFMAGSSRLAEIIRFALE